MTIAIRYDGSTRTLSTNPDADGDSFYISEVEGLDGADVQFEISDSYGNGGIPRQGRLSKRELTIEGIASAAGNVDNITERVRAKLSRMFAENTWQGTRWLYVDLSAPGISKQLKAWKSDKPEMGTARGSNQPFKIPLTCADPLAYDQVLTSFNIPAGGSVTVTNIGDTPTWISATLTASVSNPYIQNDSTGGRLSLSGAIGAGSKIDCHSRMTWDAAGLRAELVGFPRDWIPVFPGVTVLSANAPWAGSLRSAWQ